jgi:hypothetical protein
MVRHSIHHDPHGPRNDPQGRPQVFQASARNARRPDPSNPQNPLRRPSFSGQAGQSPGRHHLETRYSRAETTAGRRPGRGCAKRNREENSQGASCSFGVRERARMTSIVDHSPTGDPYSGRMGSRRMASRSGRTAAPTAGHLALARWRPRSTRLARLPRVQRASIYDDEMSCVL